MKEIVIPSFEEGQYIYCSRIPGIHKILKVLKNQDRYPILITEHLYSPKYEKVKGSVRDREHTVDGTYCSIIDFVKLYLHELSKFEHIKTIILKLDSNSVPM
jgi:hypothetical protein